MRNLFANNNRPVSGVENPISIRQRAWGLRSVCCAGSTTLFSAAAVVGGVIWARVSSATMEDNNKYVFDKTPWDGDTCGNIFNSTLAKYSAMLDYHYGVSAACEDLYQLEGTSCEDVLKKYCDAEKDLLFASLVWSAALSITIFALTLTMGKMHVYCDANRVRAGGLSDPLNAAEGNSEDSLPSESCNFRLTVLSEVD